MSSDRVLNVFQGAVLALLFEVFAGIALWLCFWR